MSPEVGHRLAALCDGEGHFGIVRRGSGYRCVFVVGLRGDDLAFLRRMRDAVGLGTVRPYPNYSRQGRNNSPAVDWRIAAQAECGQLVRILDAYPLWSKKGREYEVWREAVHHWLTMAFRGRVRLDWSRMAEYADAIRDQRSYRDLSPSGAGK